MDDSEATPGARERSVVEELEALRAQNRAYQKLLERAPLAYQALDDNGRLLTVNPAWLRMLGYSRDEVVGRAFGSFLVPGQQAVVEQSLLHLKDVGEVGAVRLRMVRKDGTVGHVELCAQTIYDETGALPRPLCVLQDVSERTRKDEALHASEKRYRSFVENLAGIAFRWNRDLSTVSCHGAVEAITGYRAEDFVAGQPRWNEIVHPDDLDAFIAVLQRGQEDPSKPVSAMCRITRKNGEVRWVQHDSHVLCDEAGNPVCIDGVLTDVTELKRVEEALRDRERLLNEAQSIANIGHWTLNPVTLEVTGSNQLFRIFELDRSQATLEAFANVVHPDDREYDLYHIRRGMEHGEPWDIVHRLLTQDGTEKTIRAKGEALLDETGKPKLVIGIVQDITAQKRLETQLAQAQKMDALGVLAGGVAHDMNNILTVVLGIASVLEKAKQAGDPEIEDIREIVTAARRGRTVVQSLLRFARKGGTERQRVSLNAIIRDVTGMLKHSLPKKVTLRVSLDDEIELVDCDQVQIAQVLVNLCLNASDALGGSGTVQMSTRNVDLAEAVPCGLAPGHYVEMQVTDHGHGMDEQTLQRAFEPFFTTKEVGKGTGLGLSMALGVAQSHGGTVTVESEPGRGTTATVLLPVSG